MSEKISQSKSWGGRFQEPVERRVEQFTASVGVDRRLYAEDIEGSMAHARALEKAGVLTRDEARAIARALAEIRAEIEDGRFAWKESLEDVHMNVEARLIEMIGDAGKKLHTARSRNDQVATDLRLYLDRQAVAMRVEIRRLQAAVVAVAEREADAIMPAFTHLQVAQPVSFGHHMMAWFEMLKRDDARFLDVRARISVLPLGSGAGAGVNYAIDRGEVAAMLGFAAISDNSLDAVSDRDFAIEFCSGCALLMMHLSRFCEELVLWASQQFGFITLPDRFCTGSSIMPQKKNPDVAELVRGKSARVFGALTALLTLMKAQPLAYNRDNQEDKEILFDALDTTLACVGVLADMLPAMHVERERLREAAQSGYSTATDLADYLVSLHVPFRDAHHAVGRAVKLAADSGRALDEITAEELAQLCPQAKIGGEIANVTRPADSLRAKQTHGGAAPELVRRQIARAKQYLAEPVVGNELP